MVDVILIATDVIGRSKMWVRTAFLIPVVLILSSVQASAQNKMIIGEGITSCGAWTEQRQLRSAKALAMSQWVIGYLSGMNIESDKADFLVVTDYQGVMGWIDNYCSSSTLDLIATAAFKLKTELQARAKR